MALRGVVPFNKILFGSARYSTAANPKTGIILLNMGGPENVDQVKGYLTRIMTDTDMIQLPIAQK